MKRIESRDNPTFRTLSALRQGRRSRESGLVFLEGSRLCADAIQSGAVVAYAILSDSGTAAKASSALVSALPDDVQRLLMPDRLFSALCDTEQPQGIALVCHSPVLSQPSGAPSATGLYLVAEGIQDPGNLGTMIRTADAFAFDGVILTGGTVHPFNDKVLRAAMGSCFHIPLLEMPDISAVAAWLASTGQNAAIIAADPAGPDSLPADLPMPAALVIGNEARGLSAEARKICSHLIGIRMPGRAESLNAAAAAAILSYELMQTRFTLNSKVL